MDDWALYQLFRRHQRLHHRWSDTEFLRVSHGTDEWKSLREEGELVHAAIWKELVARGGHSKEPMTFEAAYDDVQSVFVQTYVQLETQFNVKT